MATQDWPSTDQAFRPSDVTPGADVPRAQWRGVYTGVREINSHASDRLTCTVSLNPCTNTDAGKRDAFFGALLSNGDNVRMPQWQRRYSAGNMLQACTLGATIAAGARTVTFSGARAGRNLITRALDFQTYGSTGWTTTNCSITGGVADPAGGTAAFTVTSSAAGDTLFKRTYTTTAHANRNAVFTVYLKSGSYTGDVRVRIRDGSGTSLGTTTATLTTDFVAWAIWVAIGAAPVADLQLEIDPVTNAAAAGETFSCYLPTFELSFYTMSNAVVRSDTLTGPVTGIPASQVRRVATGNHSLTWTYTAASTANRTFTLSVWIISGSLSGDIRLRLRDGAGTAHGTGNLTPTGTWTRYSLTATYASTAAADVVALVDPVDDAGAANDSFGMYGLQLEEGAGTTDFNRYATLQAGDWFTIADNLYQVAYSGATANAAGAMTVPVVYPAQKAATAGATVVVADPRGTWQVDTDALPTGYGAGGFQGGFAIPLRQVVV